MMARWRGRAAALTLLITALATSRVAGAAPTEADKARARSLLNEGYDLMEKADPKTALDKFREADALVHLPITRLSIARAQSAAGQLMLARITLQPLLDEKPKRGEPAAFTQARRDAEDLAARLDVSIPSIVVTLVSPPPDVFVRLDDHPFQAMQLGLPQKVDPGAHTIVATGGGQEKHTAFTLAEGETRPIALDFTAPAVAPIAPVAPVPAQRLGDQPARPSPPAHTGTRWLAWIGFGVGAVGLGLGAAEGGLALSARDRATQDGCVNGKCPPNAQSDEHSSQQSATISTIAFSVGAAGVVAGVVGLLIPAGSSTEHPSDARWDGPRPSRGPSAHVVIGPAYLGLSGEM
jgi:hypothetical protein